MAGECSPSSARLWLAGFSVVVLTDGAGVLGAEGGDHEGAGEVVAMQDSPRQTQAAHPRQVFPYMEARF